MQQKFGNQKNALKMFLNLEPPAEINAKEWGEKAGYTMTEVGGSGFLKLIRKLQRNNAMQFERNKKSPEMCRICQIDKSTISDILAGKTNANSCQGNLRRAPEVESIIEETPKAKEEVAEVEEEEKVEEVRAFVYEEFGVAEQETDIELSDDFQPLATIEMDGWEIVDEEGEKWIRGEEMRKHLGYEDKDSITKIYNRHKDFFIEGKDSVTVKLTATDGKEYETRAFSFTGGLKICRYSEMPKADEVMQQLIDLGEKVRMGALQDSSIEQHILKWQDALMINVVQPKLKELEGSIVDTNTRIDTKIDPQLKALKEENAKLEREKEIIRRHLIEHEAQATSELQKHKERRLATKIGELGRTEIRLLNTEHWKYWQNHRQRYNHKQSGDAPPYEEGLTILEDMQERITKYLVYNPKALNRLRDEDKNLLLTYGVWGNWEESEITDAAS